MSKKYDVLSLFGGLEGAMIALKTANIQVGKYYSSEISKSAIALSKGNFHEIIQLDCVTKIVNPPKVDILIGGSPCQGFSINGNRLNFDHPQSKLFFEYVRIKEVINPQFWLLENVATMRPEIKKMIDNIMGVEGIVINSNTVSAQNRARIYWTNIPIDPMNRYKVSSIRIQDVLDDDFDKKLLLSVEKIAKQRFSPTETNGVITINPKKHDGSQTYQQDRIYNWRGRFPALTATLGNRFNIEDRFGNIRRLSVREQARLQTIPDWYDFSFVSDNEASKAIGNGWTNNIVSKILSEIKYAKP